MALQRRLAIGFGSPSAALCIKIASLAGRLPQDVCWACGVMGVHADHVLVFLFSGDGAEETKRIVVDGPIVPGGFAPPSGEQLKRLNRGTLCTYVTCLSSMVRGLASPDHP